MAGKMNCNSKTVDKMNENDDEEMADGTKNPKDDSLDQHQQTINGSLRLLWKTHLPENRKALEESQINLDKIANYCEGNYIDDEFKDEAFVLTKNYCQQALASVTSQIYSYASNIQAAFNLLDNQFDMLQAQTKYIEKKFLLNQEKIHRKEIGMLTIPKHNQIQPRVIYPSIAKTKTIQNSRYVFEPIDMTILDHIGVAHKIREERDQKTKASTIQENRQMPTIKSATLRPSKSTNLSSIVIAHNPNNLNNPSSNDNSTLYPGQRSQPGMMAAGHHQSNPRSYGTLTNQATIPQTLSTNVPSTNAMFGSLARNQKDYRQLYPVPLMMIPPPQVPSNYISMKELNDGSNSTVTSTTSSSVTGTITATSATATSSSSSALLNPPSASSRKSSTTSSTGMINDSIVGSDPQGSSKPSTNNDSDPGQLLPPPPSPLPSMVNENDSDQDWIPTNYLEKVIAIYDYNADKDDELSFQENSVIYVIRKNDDGWWEGIMNGITGLFPGNYVEHCM